MSLAEILLVSVGLSFDVFAAMICEGAMLARVEKKKLIFICLIFCIWQQAAVVCGNLITLIPVFADSSREMQTAGSCLSMIIFVTLGIYMLWKAYRKEAFLEQCAKISYRKIWLLAVATSIDAFFAGIGFGFLDAEMAAVGLTLAVITALFVIGGIYTGYRLGYEEKAKAHGIGGVILIIAGMDVIIRYLIK